MTTRLEQYESLGFTDPVPTLSFEQCQAFLSQSAKYFSDNPQVEWAKGHAPYSKLFYDLAMHPSIISVIAELIGDDIILWASGMVTRPPGFNHPWHSDIESSLPPEKTCTAWIAINNVNASTSLRVISHSDKFDTTVQEMNFRHGKKRGQSTTEDVLQWARERNPESDVHQADMRDGEVLYFDGHIWHHSNNTTRLTRHAVILQYAVPQAKMRRTDMSNRLAWPLIQLEKPRPPCLRVKGQINDVLNRIVQPPSA